LYKRGDHGEAAALFEQVLAIQRRVLPEDRPDIASSLNNLANCHSSQGEYDKAVLLREEALAVQRRLLPEDHPHIAASLNNLASCHTSQGEYATAVVLHEEALAVKRRLLPEDHLHIAASLNNLANCHFSQGEYGKAILLHEEALAVRRRLLPEDHSDIAVSLNNLGNCHESQGEYGKAVMLREEALAVQRRLLPEDHPEGGASSSSDARADVWSWGVLLHSLLTRSTAMAKGESVSAYLTVMEGEQWREDAATLWVGDEELVQDVFKAVKHSLCERGKRVGLLAGAGLLGQRGLVEETVGGMDAPEEVKEAELRTAITETCSTYYNRMCRPLLPLQAPSFDQAEATHGHVPDPRALPTKEGSHAQKAASN
jgi:hypothetical protein